VCSCSAVAKVGSTCTYTYTLTSGPALRVGMSLATAGMTNSGNNNAALVITALGSGTFSVTNSSGVAESGSSGTAQTTALTAMPGSGASYYEIWQTGDSVGFPVSVKMEYYTVNGTYFGPAVTIGTGSNGAGTLIYPSTRIAMNYGSAGAGNTYACHLSGDPGRMVMNLFHGYSSTTELCISLERSYDNYGNPTGSYYNLCTFSPSASAVANYTCQTLFPTGATTTEETGGWPVLIPKTAATGNVGSTTHVSPIFPLVGGPGNPLTQVLVFRGTDFADNQQVYSSLYGTQHPYITVGANNTSITAQAVACGYMTRYD
jgi:hypothetical protein